MTDWDIVYYSDEVQETICSWPVGVRAYYARLTERMRVFGPNLGMPFTRSVGQGLFEIRADGGPRKGVLLHGGRAQDHRPACIRQEIAKGAAKGSSKSPTSAWPTCETQGGR